MTEEEGAPEPERREMTPRERRVLEILLWVASPLLLLTAAVAIALVLGAPWQRSVVVFALCAAIGGVWLLSKPQSWAPIGPVRAGALIYSGIGALCLALVFWAPRAEPAASTPPDRAQTDQPQTASARPPAPRHRRFYPWPYAVASLTLNCRASTSPGAFVVTATTEDGREFALGEGASGAYPEIAPILNSDLPVDQMRQGQAAVSAAAASLCPPIGQASASLIATPGEAPPPPPPPPSPWAYQTDVDEMSDGRTSHACTRSTNVVNLGWPYETQRVSLCVRQHPRWGQDVIVRLESRGQFLCTSYRDCTVRVRFDDGEAAAYSARQPADNSTETIFIVNDARFVANLRRSSRVIIEANFYQAGAQRMSFNTSQLNWPPT
ncbi:hypothetical protein [Vitreimonas flagellata]|uniref:hypothetical protein n=1 Tax=Vitreimonas flagellata TaxID=2560861 RepID=UPI001074E9D9|nr:hypothetical protein [Vitreimonas flagellata]